MSLHYKLNGTPPSIDDYGESCCKQAFKDECDINKLLARGQVQAATTHLEAYGAQYGDFTGYDFAEHMNKLTQGRQLFDKLPSEVRNEFGQSPERFFEFVNHPDNVDRLHEVLPALAQPGRNFPDVSPSTEPGAVLGDVPQPPSQEPASEPSAEPAPAPETPPEPSG